MWHTALWMAAIVSGLVGYFLALDWVLADWLDDRRPAARMACDRAVETLQQSDNLVEITRAGILIEGLNCSVRRRIK